MLKPAKSYNDLYNSFHWEVPEFYNIGVDICDKHARDSNLLALIYEKENGVVNTYTFSELKGLSNRLANALLAHDMAVGDRLGILLPQSPETAIAHVAAYKIGAIAIPLFTLFGTDALSYRLRDSEATCLVTDDANLQKILAIREQLPALKHIFVVGAGAQPGIIDFWEAVQKGARELTPVQTRK